MTGSCSPRATRCTRPPSASLCWRAWSARNRAARPARWWSVGARPGAAADPQRRRADADRSFGMTAGAMRHRKREAVPDPQVRLERIKRRISDAEYRVEADKVAHAIVARL